MLFYGIIGMHFIHVAIAACMIHVAIFYTKNTNIITPLYTDHRSKLKTSHYSSYYESLHLGRFRSLYIYFRRKDVKDIRLYQIRYEAARCQNYLLTSKIKKHNDLIKKWYTNENFKLSLHELDMTLPPSAVIIR